MSVDVTMGVKNWPISRGFLLVVTWFFNFFQISDVDPKPYAGRHIRAIFHANPQGESLNKLSGEKKKEKQKNNQE